MDPTRKITRLKDGRFIVAGFNETRAPAVLDSFARYVRMLAREGRGPGEVFVTDVITVANGDSLWVLEPGRRHVFDPQLRFVRNDYYPPAGDVVVSGDGSAIVAANISSADRAGLPLHIVAPDGSMLRSFGRADPTIDPRRLQQLNDSPSDLLHRRIVPDGSGGIWTFNSTRFLLERYNGAGELVAHVRHALDGWYAEASKVSPGRGEFPGRSLYFVQPSADRELLWLVYLVPNDAFARRDRTRSLTGPSPYDGMHDLVIEAFDTRTLEVVATLRRPGTSVVRIDNAPDLIGVFERLNTYFATYRLHRLKLVREPTGGIK
jgi:hypothetical protein